MSEKMSNKTNALNWFEISVSDIKRAVKFYEAIFEIKLDVAEMMGMQMAVFPYDAEGSKVGGALVQSETHKPSSTGSVIYLNANPDLQLVMDRVEKNGGKITMPKTHINDDIGNMGFILDTEGNSVALHSNK